MGNNYKDDVIKIIRARPQLNDIAVARRFYRKLFAEGLLVESESLADAIATSIENDIAAGNSWQVIISDSGQIDWVTKQNGVVTRETETEPMTSSARRAEADLLIVVPDESQL